MPNVVDNLKAEILRLAKKEAKAEIASAKKVTGEYRTEVAKLKRELAKKDRIIERLKKQEPIDVDKLSGVRFSARSVISQRRRLGFTLEQYAHLVGVSPLTIRHWEAGTARPQRAQLMRLVEVRGIGKHEALQRLEIE